MPVAPYGSWASPITSDFVTADAVRLGQVMLDGSDIYWIESQPQMKGRFLVFRERGDGAVEAVTPDDGAAWNVRTRVHEYGGGAFSVAGGVVTFSNYADQRLYRQALGEAPRPITMPPANGPATALRYADGAIDTRGMAFSWCTRITPSPAQSGTCWRGWISTARCRSASSLPATTSMRRRGLVQTAGSLPG